MPPSSSPKSFFNFCSTCLSVTGSTLYFSQCLLANRGNSIALHDKINLQGYSSDRARIFLKKSPTDTPETSLIPSKIIYNLPLCHNISFSSSVKPDK